MNLKKIAKTIIELKEADLELREKLIQSGRLGEGYDEKMRHLHNRNAAILEDIIDTIGYPTTEKVGKKASQAAWLVIQHSIGQPTFMKKSQEFLEIAVKENQADPKALAYLTDRIAIYEGRLQLYGTQFDWDKQGEMVPNDFDDLDKVNQRRKAIGLNSLEEQIKIMKERVKIENQRPPTDFEKRKREFDRWRKSVGWID